MTKKSVRAYVLVVSFIFAFAFIFFSTSLIREYKRSLIETGKQFDNLLSEMKRNDVRGIQAIAKKQNLKNDFAFLIIEDDGKIIFSYPQTINEASAKRNFLFRIYSARFSVNEHSSISLRTAFYLIKPASFFSIARIAFLIVLFPTCLTLILIFAVSINAVPEKISASEYKYENETDEKDTEKTSYADAIKNDIAFQKQLSTSIMRTESFSKDMSLMLIYFPLLVPNTSAHEAVSSYLAQKFSRDDFRFEKEKCIAIIQENCDIQECLARAESIYTNINSLAENTYGEKCAIGISSRGDRHVTSDTIFFETEQALANAMSDDSLPIVAFQADAEKFRKIM